MEKIPNFDHGFDKEKKIDKKVLEENNSDESLENPEQEMEGLKDLVDTLQKKVEEIESKPEKPAGWEKIKENIFKTTRRMTRLLTGLTIVGATFSVVNYQSSRYEVQAVEKPDSQKEYKHEDSRTTHYLEVLAGRDTLDFEDFKQYLVPFWQLEVDEFLEMDLEKPLKEMSMEEMDQLFIETNLYNGATATKVMQQRYEKYLSHFEEPEDNKIPIEAVYDLVWKMEQEVGNPKIRLEGTPKFRHLFYVLSSYLRVYSSANFKGAIPNALCILERL